MCSSSMCKILFYVVIQPSKTKLNLSQNEQRLFIHERKARGHICCHFHWHFVVIADEQKIQILISYVDASRQDMET
jgi:hypothetical protein